MHMGDFAVKDGQTILFIGDSITDCGRRGTEAPLGNGYVRFVSELATARYPERSIRYINKGIGGNRVTDLKERWQDDVVVHKPDWLSIKIGINDLHSLLMGLAGAVSPALFEETYDAILRETKREVGCPVLLISPFYISRDRTGQTFRSRVLDLLPQYLDVVYRMHERHGTRLVRLHDLFQRHLEYRDADAFCPEPVHPHHAGHIVIAEAVMQALTD
jgi:lysophospholipase L1-like esterase